MAQAWDETGKPITASAPQAWDETGKPITAAAPTPPVNAPGVPKPPLPTGLRPRAEAFPGATGPVMGAPIMPAEAILPTVASWGLSKLDRPQNPAELQRAFPGATSPVQGGPVMPRVGTEPMAARGLNRLIPSTERAGQNFQKVLQTAKDVPINTTDAANVVTRAQELASRGSALPKVMKDFAKTTALPKSGVGPLQPVNYGEGRDFASNAGRLSIAERMNTNGDMGRQVKLLAKSLNDANEDAADRAGVGDAYRSAMKEYRQAKQLKMAGAVAGTAAVGAMKLGAATELAKKVLGFGFH